MEKKWSTPKSKYGYSEDLYLGKIKVASVWSNITRSKEDPKAWRMGVLLPGIRLAEGSTDFEKMDQAKARAEQAVDTWFSWLEQERTSK